MPRRFNSLIVSQGESYSQVGALDKRIKRTGKSQIAVKIMESDIGEEASREKKTASSTEIEGLTEQAHKQCEHFVQGVHEMTACALAAIDACSADVPQTSQLLKLLIQQGGDRQTKQECLELLQSSFEKHMIAYEEEEQKHMHSLWGPMNTQQQDLQVRLEIGNQLHSLRLQKQKAGEALLWLELMSGPPS